MSNVRYLPVISRNESCKLRESDICYIIRDRRRLNFETVLGEMHSYGSMDDLEGMLGPDFYRCMSGCIINITRIKDMKDDAVLFENGKYCKMGRDTYRKVKQKFNTYLFRIMQKNKDKK